MYVINDENLASAFLEQIVTKIRKDNPTKKLIGCEMGIAFGGGVERMGKIWNKDDIVYGFDTFVGHPKHLADDITSFEAECMNSRYKEDTRIPGFDFHYTPEKITYEYQRSQLDQQGLSNVILIKGEINQDTNLDYIPYLDYAFLDLDILKCMLDAYNLVKNLIVPGGYLCLHDVLPRKHMRGLYDLYQTILQEGFTLVSEHPKSYLAILQKR